MNMPQALTLQNVSQRYASRSVLQNISCQILFGRIVLVAGPNGAGKSTLVKIMAGLLSPEQGQVRCAVPVHRLAYMGHQTFLYPGLTALENLRFWSRLYARPSDEATLLSLLGRVGLKAFAFEPARTFSRGMAQRLSLARVLLVRPLLLFLDEPSTGLDARSRQVLHTEILMAREHGAAVVWISHDLEQDKTLADDVLYLSRRKMCFFGPASTFTQEEM